jgi:hypothetical protein
MKLILGIFFGISSVLVLPILGQMWAIEYRGPLITGMNTALSPAVELGSSPYKETGLLKI